MNYKYLFIGFLALSIGALVPYQIYKIRQRRLAERLNTDQHSESSDHTCCSCH